MKNFHHGRRQTHERGIKGLGPTKRKASIMEPWIIKLPVGMAGSASVNCTELVMKIKYILCAKTCANALLFFILLIIQTGCGPSNRDKDINKLTNKRMDNDRKEIKTKNILEEKK